MKHKQGGADGFVCRATLFVCFLMAALSAAGADFGLQGPVTGFVLDPRSHSIRPINGLPGSSTLGPALDLPSIDRAVFAGQPDFAIAFGGGSVFLVRDLRRSEPRILPLPISIPDPVSAALNATGSAAVFYSQSPRSLQVVSGLPDNPAAAAAIDLSMLPGDIAAVALDVGGSSILLAAEGSVFLVRTDGSGPRFLANSPSPASILYLNQDRDALVADRSSNQIVLIREVRGAADVFVQASEHDGISAPVGVELSADGLSVLVANAGSSSVSVHSLAGLTPPSQFSLPVVPSRFDKLNGGLVMRFNDIGSGPLFLLDEAGGRQVYFVPVD